MKPVLIDFESRSRADLKKVGGRLYWEHASTIALCVVWYDTADGTCGVWVPGQAWPHAGRVLGAHNAETFDRFGAERYDFRAAGWVDTMQLARKAGLPGALDALGTRWCGIPKDDEGSKFTKALSSVRRPVPRVIKADPRRVMCPKCYASVGAECVDKEGQPRKPHKARDASAYDTRTWGIEPAEWNTLSDDAKRTFGVQPEITVEVLDRVIKYCASDVAILAQAWPRLVQWLDVDAEIEAVNAAINARGMAFDIKLAYRLLEEDARNAALAVREVAAQLGMTEIAVREAARSPAQFCALTGAPDAQADTVEKMDHPLAKARKALASIAKGKLEAGLTRVHADGRLRDTLLYYGGHTGRWSGRGMQLHNLPRPAKKFEDLPADTTIPFIMIGNKRAVDVDRHAAEVLAGAHCDAESVAMLVRATLTASSGNLLIACDFSSIEALATAWCAFDTDELDVYVQKRDPYKVAAAGIFGTTYENVSKAQRQIGKVAILACGYGGGPNAFEKMARTYKVSLEGVNAREIVTAWRALHRPIVSLWYECERAFRAAVGGKKQHAGPFTFVPSDTGDAVACFLPSDRPIVYQDAKASESGLTYWGTKGVEHVYGGKLVENAVQALCRDMMTSALLRVETEGLNPVLHVHDEIVCDVPAAQAQEVATRLHDIMVTTPAWMATYIAAQNWAEFPLKAEGWIGQRYRK